MFITDSIRCCTNFSGKSITCITCSKTLKSPQALTIHSLSHTPAANFAKGAGSEREQQSEGFKKPVLVPPLSKKQQCNACGGLFVNILNHRVCSKKLQLLKARSLSPEENQLGKYSTDTSSVSSYEESELDTSTTTSTPNLRHVAKRLQEETKTGKLETEKKFLCWTHLTQKLT